MRKGAFLIGLITGIIVVGVSCTKLEPDAPADDQKLDGLVDGLNYAEAAQHARGDAAFTNQVFTSDHGTWINFRGYKLW